ncbi:urease subunit alpha [Alkalihalobacillus oceani]|uniref:urease subunit alpha n=1 Tax=Halalkalibacter oceani TaxID=1653776 RepID=UPI002041ADAC|nr:urease subunit alpha [Halalkalibacter oceani]
MKYSRRNYGEVYGPTVGDKISLADTNLWIEIEKDYNKESYGDEAVVGGGKTVRDGMGLSNTSSKSETLDFAITNVIIMDPELGIIKGDIGIKDGIIVGIGKAGNPETMDITPGLVIGPGTDIISASPGMIATAGGIDTHIHFISADQVNESLSSGLTTMIGGGSGPVTLAIDAAGEFNVQRMIEAFESFPINVGIIGKGTLSQREAVIEQIEAGVIGLKIHEDWGATPAVIDNCLAVADEYDVQVQIHTDTLNEAGYVDDTLNAINKRTIHAYHVEGAGGGHAPDILECVSYPWILPSSTNPTNPFTVNTVDEHLDMIMVAHHLNPLIPEDVSFADSRVRYETIGAEDVLHDLGAISMMSSDSQGMGRVGETISRTWQLAAKMKLQRGPLAGDSEYNDNNRVLRYLAKYTSNPAIALGIQDYVGSIKPGKVADIVLWKHDFFGAKPERIIKSGFVVWSAMGEPNASVMTCQPITYRPQFGAFGSNPNRLSYVFTNKLALEKGLKEKVPNSAQKLLPVRNTRNIGKKDMIRNDYCPNIKVDPETYKVSIDDVPIEAEPITDLPLNKLYFLR